MSFQDTAFIFFIALLLFGPKKLPELARYVGKLMGEFRRASNEFRMQMEDELRVAEQTEQQKKIEAMSAAAPLSPALAIPEPEHPHMPPPVESSLATLEEPTSQPSSEHSADHSIDARPLDACPPEPLPIASSGALDMMPPATGLPVARTSGTGSFAGAFDSIPHIPDPETSTHA